MQKTILLLSLIFLLAGCDSQSGSPKTSLPPASRDYLAEGEDITLPADLLHCQSTDSDSNKLCPAENSAVFCEYFQNIYPNGQVTYHNNERANLCLYCKQFGSDNELAVGGVKVRALGYENRPCY